MADNNYLANLTANVSPSVVNTKVESIAANNYLTNLVGSLKAPDKSFIDGRYDPSAKLQQVFHEDLNTFMPFSGGNSMPFVQGRDEAFETRAKAQTTGQLWANGTAQFFLGEILGGTVSGTGTLLRPDKWATRFFDASGAFERTIIESLGDSIQEATRKAFPVYQTNAASKGVALNDGTWWATILPSVGSVISIMFPARMAAILPAKLSRLIGETYAIKKLGAMGRLAEGSEAGARFLSTSKALRQTDYWSTVLSSAVAGRVIDSTRESLGKYDQYYEERKALGFNDSDARAFAGEAAAGGFRKSHLNLAFDIVEWATMLKMANYLTKETEGAYKALFGSMARKGNKTAGLMIGERGVAETALKSRVLNTAGQMGKISLVEGTDEMTMDIAQNEGAYKARQGRGEVKESDFSDRLSKHVGDRKNWDSFFGGAFGGLLMMPFGVAMEHITNRKGIARMEAHAKSMIENVDYIRTQIQDISKAEDEGNTHHANMIRSNMLTDIAAKSLMNNSFAFDKQMLKDFATKSDEQLTEEGFNPAIKAHVETMIEDMDKFKNIFEETAAYYSIKNKEVLPHDLFVANIIAKHKFQKSKIDSIVSELSDKINGIRDENSQVISIMTTEEKAYYEYLREGLYRNEDHQALLLSNNEAIEQSKREAANATSVLAKTTNPIRKYLAKATLVAAELNIKSSQEIIDKLRTNKPIEDKTYADKAVAFDNMDSSLKSKTKDIVDKLPKMNKEGSISTQLADFRAKQSSSDINIAYYKSDEGYDYLVGLYNDKIKSNEQETKATIDSEIRATTTQKELDDLVKKYKKDAVESSLYDTALSSHRTKLKNDEIVKKQNAQRTASTTAITEQEHVASSNNPNAKPATSSSDTGINLTNGRQSNDVAVDFSNTEANGIITSEVGVDTLELYVIEEGEEDTAEAREYNNYQRHVVKLLDIITSNKEVLVKLGLTPNSTIKDFMVLTFTPNPGESQEMTDRRALAASILDSISEVASEISRSFDLFINPSTKTKITIELNDHPQQTRDFVNLIDVVLRVNNVNTEISKEISKSLTRHLSSLDTLAQDADILNKPFARFDKEANDLIEKIFENMSNDFNNVYEVKDVENVQNVVNSIRDFVKQVYGIKARQYGYVPESITFTDILKVLRDKDTTNDFLKRHFNDVVVGLRITKLWYANLIKSTETEVKQLADQIAKGNKNPDIAKQLANAQATLTRATKLDSIIDITELDETVKEANGYVTVKHRKLDEEYVLNFIRSHPREITKVLTKSGHHVVINVFNKKGEKIGERYLDENDEFVNSENEHAPIYDHLDELDIDTELVFEADYNYDFENRPKDKDGNAIPYGWASTPIRVKLRNPKEGNDDTLFWIKPLDYVVGGYQYGNNTSEDPTLEEYSFRGMSQAFHDGDYLRIQEDMKSANSAIREFYANYVTAEKANTTPNVTKEAFKKYSRAYDRIKADKVLNEMFLRVYNQNLANPLTELTVEAVARILDPVYYAVKSEDYINYRPDASNIKRSILIKDDAIKFDFAQAFAIRSNIASGVDVPVRIQTISTPSFLINEDKVVNGKKQPRGLIIDTVKTVDMNDERGPRVVYVKYVDGKFRDMTTGNIINDPRFDSAKYLESFKRDQGHRSGLFTLNESPNKKLHLFDVKANTIGLSGTEAQRSMMVDKVSNAFMDALLSTTGDTMDSTLDAIKHITIYDKNSEVTHRDSRGNEIFTAKHLLNEVFQNPDGTTDAWLRFKVITNINGKSTYMYYQIQNKKGIVNIYRSTTYEAVYIKQENVGKDAYVDAHNNSNIAKLNNKPELADININTAAGKAQVMELIKSIVPNLSRQTHVDMETGKFSFEKGYKDGVIISPIDGKTEYANAEDFYNQTGSLYTNLGAVKNDDGEILSNFDINGRFPLSVTINTDGSPTRDSLFDSVGALVSHRAIDQNDPYLPLLLEVEKAVGNSLAYIGTTRTQNSKAVASTVQAPIDPMALFSANRKAHRSYNNRYAMILRDAYFVLKGAKNIYDPSSVNILHELIHMYMNAKYQGTLNETAEEQAIRHERILTHNRAMTDFTNHLTTRWSNMTEVEKSALIGKIFNIQNQDSIDIYRGIFDQFIIKINDDLLKNKLVEAALADGTKLNHNHSIQEVITYSHSNPVVASILNGLTTDETHTDNTKVKKSFWVKLKEHLFDILKKLFNITYNNKSEYARLTTTVDMLFSRPSKARTETLSKKELAAPQMTPEDNQPSTDEAVEKPVDDVETDLDREASDEANKALWGDDLDDQDSSPLYLQPDLINEDIDVKAVDLQGIVDDYYINPLKVILDANRLPIC